jgi:hypothetical protein
MLVCAVVNALYCVYSYVPLYRLLHMLEYYCVLFLYALESKDYVRGVTYKKYANLL